MPNTLMSPGPRFRKLHEQITIFRPRASDEIHVHGVSEKNGKRVFLVPNYKQKNNKHPNHYVSVEVAWHAQEPGTSLPEATG